MKQNALLSMQQAIIRYIDFQMPKDTNRAFFGTVNGKRVTIGNRSYTFEPVVDTFFGNGDSVACILPNSGNTAAVVGVR